MRLALLLAAWILGILALLAVLGYGFYASLAPAQQQVVEDALSEQAALLVGSVLLFATLLGIALRAFVGRYAGAAARMAGETALIAAANPDHRVREEGAAELQALARALNELAGRHAQLRRDVDDVGRRARADVEQERDRLAALMAELSQAVLVCNVNGRILLYNSAAQELLGSDGGDTGFVGLGRSVFGLIERDLVLHALGYLRQDADAHGERPTARFATEAGGRLLRVHMAAVHERGGAMTGFILTLEDVTRQATLAARSGAMLRRLREGTLAPVANIRAAVESMLQYGELDPAERERFLEIVRTEVLRLSERVEQTLDASADLVAVQWSLDEVRGRELLAAISRELEDRRGIRGTIVDGAAEVWLLADSYSLVRAVAAVAERVAADHGVSEFVLTLDRVEANAALDLRWADAAPDADELRAWERLEVLGDGLQERLTLRDVLDRHGAEMWSQDDPQRGTAVLRLLLPAAPEPPPAPPARRAEMDGEPRPEFYDFELFERMELGPRREDRPLAELAYTVFDTETTGLDPDADEIIAIGAVRVLNGRLLPQETFEQLVSPGVAISAASTRVHGITEEMLRGQPGIATVLPSFSRFAEDTVLVGHNVAFDMRFLAETERRTGVRFTQPVLDTLLLSAVAQPGEDPSLEAVAARLGVEVIGRHTALGDALVTAEVFVRLVRLLEERGVATLADALAAARRTYEARVSDSLYGRR